MKRDWTPWATVIAAIIMGLSTIVCTVITSNRNSTQLNVFHAKQEHRFDAVYKRLGMPKE